MPRQPLVEERVIRRQQLRDPAVVLKLAADEQFGFLAERLAQVLVELREQIRIRDGIAQVAELQPLAGEVLDEGLRARIAQHAAHLRLEHAAVAQRSLGGAVEQLVVRDAAPQEERQAGGELDVVDAVRRAGRGARRIQLDAEQEVGAHQHPLQRGLDARLETVRRPIEGRRVGPIEGRRVAADAVELDERVDVAGGHRAAVGAARQRAEDRARAAFLARCRLRTAAEDPLAAWRVAHAGRLERPLDGDAIDRRVGVEHLVGAEPPPGARRLHHVLRFPGAVDEREADRARAGFDGNRGREPLVRVVRVLFPLGVPRQRAGEAGRRRLDLGPADRERVHALPIEPQLELMRVGQAADRVIERSSEDGW